MLKRILPASAATVAMSALMLTGQQRPAVFTAEQASSGRAAYQTNCSTCHGPELAGRNEAPQLAGNNFMSALGGRTIGDLATLIRTTMPPGAPNSLTEKTTVDIVAFLLESNGAAAGNKPLVVTAANVIRSVATGRAPQPAAAAAGRGGRGGAAAAGAGGRGLGQGVFPVNLAPPRGLTVDGVVKNYAPVTDEMLRNPDPGDWLMLRRNYQAHSYSPLAEITAANVQDLRLVWSRAMNESGAN
ncbi:MAG TPA: c-type cytochrome, partial [Bryobacteraceae bacterium]|nr:c-type cytochrome [Bryobacteraceae bacterium]